MFLGRRSFQTATATECNRRHVGRGKEKEVGGSGMFQVHVGNISGQVVWSTLDGNSSMKNALPYVKPTLAKLWDLFSWVQNPLTGGPSWYLGHSKVFTSGNRKTANIFSNLLQTTEDGNDIPFPTSNYKHLWGESDLNQGNISKDRQLRKYQPRGRGMLAAKA